MKNLFVYALLVMCTILITYTVHADKTSDLSAYPEKDYLVGVKEGINVSKVSLKARAEALLTEKVFDKVKIIITSNRMNKEAYDQVWEHYGLVLQGSQDAKLKGLNTKHGASYVIVYTKRSALQNIYAQQESELRNRINSILGRAQTADNRGELNTAAEIFMSSYNLYEALKEAELIQLGAKYSRSGNEFTNLAAAAVGTSKGTLLMSHKEVINRVNEIRKPMIYNLDTIADFAANQFRQQDSPLTGKVQQGNIKYGPYYSSPQASGTATAIASKLGWSLVPPTRALKLISGSTRSGGTPSTPLKIYGTYWEDGDRITLRTALRDMKTGEFKASAVVQFQESQRKDSQHINIKPAGYDGANKDRETYGGGTTPTTPGKVSGGTTPGNVGGGNTGTGGPSQIQTTAITTGSLTVTIDTDRGPGPITLTEGETVRLYVSVNEEAYLQLIYVLQDKRRILLMDNNFHIDSSKVDTIVEIGQFECAPPFGIEELYVYAQPAPFPEFKPGETYEEDGFVFLKKTRALRLVRPKSILSITTTEQ